MIGWAFAMDGDEKTAGKFVGQGLDCGFSNKQGNMKGK